MSGTENPFISLFHGDTHFVDLSKVVNHLPHIDVDALPISIKIILEGMLRHAHCHNFDDRLLTHFDYRNKDSLCLFYIHRVLMQDFTGVPSIVDLIAMRDAVKANGGDPSIINPKCLNF